MLLLCCYTAQAQTTESAPLIPISIIIDDMGDRQQHGLRALDLPGNITYSFIPHTTYSHSLAIAAHQMGKEVMIHIPMESESGKKLGPGGLLLEMEEPEFKQTLKAAIEAIPHAKGVNNHMGSLLTRQPRQMQWLMDILHKNSRLYFIDSRTTAKTVALQLAQKNHIPSRERDIFLDNDPSPTAIAQQFQRLVEHAKKMGSAIAIGHPYDTTLSQLEQQLPQLKALGLELVPVSELLNSAQKLKQAQSNTKRLHITSGHPSRQ